MITRLAHRSGQADDFDGARCLPSSPLTAASSPHGQAAYGYRVADRDRRWDASRSVARCPACIAIWHDRHTHRTHRSPGRARPPAVVECPAGVRLRQRREVPGPPHRGCAPARRAGGQGRPAVALPGDLTRPGRRARPDRRGPGSCRARAATAGGAGRRRSASWGLPSAAWPRRDRAPRRRAGRPCAR